MASRVQGIGVPTGRGRRSDERATAIATERASSAIGKSPRRNRRWQQPCRHRIVNLGDEPFFISRANAKRSAYSQLMRGTDRPDEHQGEMRRDSSWPKT